MSRAWSHFIEAVNTHKRVSYSDITDLLSLIQAPPTLKSFSYHIPLLPELFEMTAAVADASGLDAGPFRKALTIANLLVSVYSGLKEDLRGTDFMGPAQIPLLGPCKGIIGSHPLYSALVETSPYNFNNKQHVHLKAQILLAMNSLKNIDQELLDILREPFAAFRTVTNKNNKDRLTELPADPVSTEAFTKVIKSIFLETKLRQICRIFEAAEIRSNRKKQEKRVTVINKSRLSRPIREDDEDPVDKYLKDALQSTTLTPKETENYIIHGGLPDELGSNIDLVPVLAQDQYNGPTLRQLALQAQQGHNRRVMANQFCALAWNQASLFDVKVLLDFIAGRIQLDDLEYHPLTQEDVIVILGLMFFTCNSLERILMLPVFPGCDPKQGQGEGVYHKKGQPVQVRLRSTGPDLSGPRVLHGAISVTQYSTIQLPPFFSECMERIGDPLSTGLARPALITAGNPDDKTSINAVLSLLRYVMGGLNSGSGARLSLGRISSYLLFRMAESEKCDLPGSMLYFGRKDKVARTRIHYTLADTGQLSSAYRTCINKLLNSIGCSGQFTPAVPAVLSGFLGTPLCPKVETVQNLAENLRAKLQHNALSPVDRHNYFALYTSLLINFGTGFRAIHDPSFREVEIDPRWSLGVIADKGTAAYRTRYVYLAPVIIEQIQHYREHIKSVYAHLGVTNPSLFDLVKSTDGEGLPLNLFILAGDVEPLELLTPGKAKVILKNEFKYTIPMNAGRHYLKYHLIKAGCSPELVEGQLGHWEAGQEPWGPFSNLDPLDFAQQLSAYIPGILKESGWLAIDRNAQ